MADAPLPDQQTKAFLNIVRRALIMVLGALEEYLGRERTIPPRRDR